MDTMLRLISHYIRDAQHQFIVIDGQQRVYHGPEDNCTVEFPGSTSKTVQELRAKGHAVLMPRYFRNELPGVLKNIPGDRAPHRSKSIGARKL